MAIASLLFLKRPASSLLLLRFSSNRTAESLHLLLWKTFTSGEELNGRRAINHKCEQRFFETVVCKSVDEYFCGFLPQAYLHPPRD